MPVAFGSRHIVEERENAKVSAFLQGFLLDAIAVMLRDFRAIAGQDDNRGRRLFDDGGAVDGDAVVQAVAVEDRRHLEVVVFLEEDLAERRGEAFFIGKVAVFRQLRFRQDSFALVLADGLDAPRHALDVRVVADGERALVLFVECFFHRLDASGRDREIVIDDGRDGHRQSQPTGLQRL